MSTFAEKQWKYIECWQIVLCGEKAVIVKKRKRMKKIVWLELSDLFDWPASQIELKANWYGQNQTRK